MHYIKISLILAAFIFLLSSCRKETLHMYDCDEIRQGIITKNMNLVNTSLGYLLTPYSNENIDKLAQGLFEGCSIYATVACYSCIHTLPAQSEITVTFSDGGNAIQKVLDISSTPGTTMKIVNVHD